MKTYNVQVPFAGYVEVGVEANSEAEAKELALEAAGDTHIEVPEKTQAPITYIEPGEYEVHEQLLRGSVLYASLNSIDAQEEK